MPLTASPDAPSRPAVPLRAGLITAIAAAAQFMVILDVSIVNVALPSIRAGIGFSEQGLQWVVSAYTLAFAGFLLLGGRAADLFGRRRVFLAGVGLFTVASVAGALALNGPMLLVARVLQGLGAAIIAPASLTILSATFPEGPARNKALGVWGSMAGAGGSVGVLAGGLLTDLLSWEWIFWINVPFGLAVLWLARRHVPEGAAAARTGGVDLLGAVTVTGGLVALVYGIVRTEAIGWAAPQTYITFALAALLLGAFVLVEARIASAPLIPLRALASRRVAGANAVVFLLGAAMFAMWFFLSLYLQQVLGYSPLEAGLAFLPMSLAIVAGSTAASRLVARFGPVAVLVTGMSMAAIGLGLFTQLTADGSFWIHVLPGSIVLAGGLGLTMVSSTVIGVSGSGPADRGLASGLLNSSRMVGGALGLAILTTVATARTSSLLEGRRPTQAAIESAATAGYAGAFTVSVALCLLAAVVALVTLRTRDRDRNGEARPEGAALS
jgi:EmrB/QacA subfamily drug resistance transporter